MIIQQSDWNSPRFVWTFFKKIGVLGFELLGSMGGIEGGLTWFAIA